MGTREKILQHIRKKTSVKGAELCGLLGISRQAVNKHLQELTRSGAVVKEGVTRGAVYRIPDRSRPTPKREFHKTYALKGLEEDRVLERADGTLNLNASLPDNVSSIVSYAFTEMLNNAIDHSKSERCKVAIDIDPYVLRFLIRDYGIGIFHSIATKFQLPDEHAAVGELIKGKTTTMKERHSGEGIFFTSKSADRMSFRSHRIQVDFETSKKDIFIHQKRFLKGTEVCFELSKRSRRQLGSIFDEFAPEEFGYRFEKTRVQVSLFDKEYVSRSESRRLLSGLDRFKEVVLDFKGVRSIGQAFADEVFRVFLRAHPSIELQVSNMSSALKPMVQHVVDNVSRPRLTID